MSNATPLEMSSPPVIPRGIRGWLLLPFVQLIAATFGFGYFALLGMWAHSSSDYARAASEPVLSLVLLLVVGLLGFIGWGFGIYCLVRFVQKKRELPRLMFYWYAIQLISNALLIFLGSADPLLYAIASGKPPPSSTAASVGLLSIALFYGILIAYFANSRRVANTFEA